MKKILFLLFALWSAVRLGAEVAAMTGNFTIASGDYTLEIDGRNRYSIRNIGYRKALLGVPTGFYGTILAPAPNQFIGSGHTDGGKELVESLTLKVDGVEVDPAPNGRFAGDTVTLEKISLLDHLRVRKLITLDSAGIRIDKRFESLAPQEVASLYVFQYCFTPNTARWLVGFPDGETREGAFSHNDGWFLRGEKLDLIYFSLFSPVDGKALLGFFPDFRPNQAQYLLWDRKIDSKFYFWANLPKSLPAGYRFPNYSILLRGFDATADDWQGKARALAEQLLTQYPPPGAPDEIRLDFDGKPSLELKGNGKFLCRKIPLELTPSARYTIRFKLKKGVNCSRESNRTDVIVGHFERDRKFTALTVLASRIPCDGEWHEVAGEFTAPTRIHDADLLIYNRDSNDSVEIDAVVIQKVK